MLLSGSRKRQLFGFTDADRCTELTTFFLKRSKSETGRFTFGVTSSGSLLSPFFLRMPRKCPFFRRIALQAVRTVGSFFQKNAQRVTWNLPNHIQKVQREKGEDSKQQLSHWPRPTDYKCMYSCSEERGGGKEVVSTRRGKGRTSAQQERRSGKKTLI